MHVILKIRIIIHECDACNLNVYSKVCLHICHLESLDCDAYLLEAAFFMSHNHAQNLNKYFSDIFFYLKAKI
jgi:hypothetical protein